MQTKSGKSNGINKALLLKILGLLWLIDAILQLQPQSFTSTFVSGILTPILPGQPQLLMPLLNFGINIYSINIAVSNTILFTLQLLIGLILLLMPYERRITKIMLVVSVIWGLLIWVFGEGLGLLFTGTATFYTGAPGSIIIYIATALFLLFPKYLNEKNLALFALGIFLLGAILELQPLFWTSPGISSSILASNDTFSFISQPATAVSSSMSSSPVASNLILTGLLFLMALIFYLYVQGTYKKKLGIYAAIIFVLLVWWLGQDFGAISSFPNGVSTDPNTALVLVLFVMLPILLPEKLKNKRSSVKKRP